MNARNPRKDSVSSPDELAVFQTYTELINSDRETLWARHNALVLANSLIIGALAISPAALWENIWATLAMLGAGLVICAAWFLMTVLAWSAMWRHCDLAASFASSCFAHLPNPFAETICREQRGIHHLTLLVIGVFILMYFGLGSIRLASV